MDKSKHLYRTASNKYITDQIVISWLKNFNTFDSMKFD